MKGGNRIWGVEFGAKNGYVRLEFRGFCQRTSSKMGNESESSSIITKGPHPEQRMKHEA
jgi:hypothetical protein